MRRIWDGEEKGLAGPIGPNLDEPPTLILGGSVDASFRRAAEHGAGWIMGGGTPDQFRDGVFFVPLEPISDPALVPSTIAATLGVQDSSNRPALDRLLDHLKERQVLLVLDNFEQVVGGAPAVGEILRASPGSKAIVTSRAPLRVSGEQEFAVPPLGLPPSASAGVEALTQYEGVTLFIERAIAVRSDFQVTNAPQLSVYLSASAQPQISADLDGVLALQGVRGLEAQIVHARIDEHIERRVATLAPVQPDPRPCWL